MARQILPIAGQIIGGMVGGPVGAAIGGAIGGALGAYVDPLRHQGPKLGEARAQTAQEGVYRPLVFGTGCVSGNIIHRSERKIVVHRESAGGKGSRDTVDTERGYRTFAIRIAEAHTPRGYVLLRIWENETLVYDARAESQIPGESVEYGQRFRFYSGSESQLPDPDLEAYMGVGNVSAYRGTSYIVFGNYDLTDYGDMIPQFRFEIASDGESTSLLAMKSVGPNTYLMGLNDEWEGAWKIQPSLQGAVHMTAGESGRVIVGHANGRPWYSDDMGATFIMADAPFNPQISAPVNVGGAILWGAGANRPVISFDNGESYSSISDSGVVGGAAQYLSRTPIRWILSRADGSAHYSDNGLNWSAFVINHLSGGPSHDVSWSDGLTARFSGQGPTGGRLISSTTDGISYSASTVSVIPAGEDITAICGNSSTLVVGTDKGKFAYRSGGAWQLAVGNMGGRVWKIIRHGRGFVAIGAGGHVTGIGNGRIMVSDNGSIWQTRVEEPEINPDAQWTNIVSISRGSSQSVSLSEIIGFCHRRSGMAGSDFNVSQLGDMVDGVVFADGYSARDAITSLLPIYNADASEFDDGSGYRINYVKRGAPVVRTLTVDDLVDEPEETVREDPMERPRVLHMAFESPVAGYTAAKASIQRLSPDVRLVNEISTYVPVTFKDVDEAWQKADVQMRVAWTEVHGERKFSIPDSHIDLVPTDNVALSLRGQVQRLRLLKNEYVDGVLKLESVADRQSNYTSRVTGIPLPAPEKPPPSLMGPAALAILDIPAISDQHDRLGYYVAVTGTADAFAGAVVQRQQNGAWADVVSIGRSQRSTMGVLENAVSAGSEHYTDTTNTVSVALYMDAELESLSNAQWLNKGGAFALETASGWEIMQYRDAEQDSDGVWHLTYLARGRLNTEAGEHLPGARFVLLDGVWFIDADVGMIGQPLTLRAAAVGRSPETAVPQTITYEGNSQREFPVAHLLGEEDSGTLTLEAVPRDRFGTEVHPLRSINHDGFRWIATDGSNTVTTDTDHATATLDVSALGSPITATVAQLNRFTGAGPTVSELIE